MAKETIKMDKEKTLSKGIWLFLVNSAQKDSILESPAILPTLRLMHVGTI